MVLAILTGYLVGSIPFAYLLARAFAGVDIRVAGSGNVGATNVFRTTRASLGIATLVLDIGKGWIVAAWLLRAGDHAAVAAAGTATIVGHIYPVWLRCRGGKGVATACGVFSILAPGATAIAAGVFGLVAWWTRYVSLGSVASVAVVPLLTLAMGKPRPFVWAAVATAALIIFRHRSNLARVLAGTERRMGGGAKRAGIAGIPPHSGRRGPEDPASKQ